MAGNTEYVILGMLMFEPMSGYQIRNLIKQTTQHFWAESDGQLYPALRRLNEQGDIHILSADEEKRRKVTYNITESGKQRFQNWVALPAKTNSVRNEMLLKLFFAGFNDKASILKQLEAEQLEIEINLAMLKTESESVSNEPNEQHDFFWLSTMTYGKVILQAKLVWCQQTIKLFKQQQ